MRKTYAYHKPSAQGVKDIAQLRERFSQLHDAILLLAPESRERSVALTHLETAAMWAVKAVVVSDPESEVMP